MSQSSLFFMLWFVFLIFCNTIQITSSWTTYLNPRRVSSESDSNSKSKSSSSNNNKWWLKSESNNNNNYNRNSYNNNRITQRSCQLCETTYNLCINNPCNIQDSCKWRYYYCRETNNCGDLKNETCTEIQTNPTRNPVRYYRSPTRNPTRNPFAWSTRRRTPTRNPTRNPMKSPTRDPYSPPTRNPTKTPSKKPTRNPIAPPTRNPTTNPIKTPTNNPSQSPTTTTITTTTTSTTTTTTISPTSEPTMEPSEDNNIPTYFPTMYPTETCESTPAGCACIIQFYNSSNCIKSSLLDFSISADKSLLIEVNRETFPREWRLHVWQMSFKILFNSNAADSQSGSECVAMGDCEPELYPEAFITNQHHTTQCVNFISSDMTCLFLLEDSN